MSENPLSVAPMLHVHLACCSRVCVSDQYALKQGWQAHFRSCLAGFDEDADTALNGTEMRQFILSLKISEDKVNSTMEFFKHGAAEAKQSNMNSAGNMTIDGIVAFYEEATNGRPNDVIGNLRTLGLENCVDLTKPGDRVAICSTHATPDVILSGLPKMDGCSSLTDLNLESCNKLTADGLAEFFAHPPPMLQTLNLQYTTLESKWLWLLFLVEPMLQHLTSSL